MASPASARASHRATWRRRGVGRALRLTVVLLLIARAAAADRALLPTITHDDLVVALAHRTAVVIEVSAVDDGKKVRGRAHLPHALTYDDLAAGRAKLPKDKQVLVVLCNDDAGRARLPEVIADLDARGYRALRRYSGGVRGWIEKGGTLEPQERPERGAGADDPAPAHGR